MPVDDIRFLIVAVAFGGLVGWSLGRWPEDRRPSLGATAAALLVGIVAWIGWAVSDDPAWGDAAVALTVGGATALTVLATTGRSSPAP